MTPKRSIVGSLAIFLSAPGPAYAQALEMDPTNPSFPGLLCWLAGLFVAVRRPLRSGRKRWRVVIYYAVLTLVIYVAAAALVVGPIARTTDSRSHAFLFMLLLVVKLGTIATASVLAAGSLGASKADVQPPAPDYFNVKVGAAVLLVLVAAGSLLFPRICKVPRYEAINRSGSEGFYRETTLLTPIWSDRLYAFEPPSAAPVGESPMRGSVPTATVCLAASESLGLWLLAEIVPSIVVTLMAGFYFGRDIRQSLESN